VRAREQVDLSGQVLEATVGTDRDWMHTFRPEIPSTARLYDYFLGGKDNFPADRELAERVLADVPEVRLYARANRAFLQRAVRYLVTEAGIRQIVDIGTGLPTAGNVHEVAQQIEPACRVVYVDHDPVVMAHALDLLHGTSNTAFIKHDLREPRDILADPELRSLTDFTRPVAILLVAVLHFISDDEQPEAIVRQLLEPFPSGSFLAISHGTIDGRPDLAPATRHYDRATSRFYPRSRGEIQGLLDNLDLISPGIVWVPQWRPDAGTESLEEPERTLGYAALSRKP
jgi:O-methyltransferase involved in polyketide biosynthesis